MKGALYHIIDHLAWRELAPWGEGDTERERERERRREKEREITCSRKQTTRETQIEGFLGPGYARPATSEPRPEPWSQWGSPWRPARPSSWRSMRRASWASVAITCRPPTAATLVLFTETSARRPRRVPPPLVEHACGGLRREKKKIWLGSIQNLGRVRAGGHYFFF